MSDIWKFLILIVSSYFVGNITFARLFALTRNKDDITTHGSGNPGTMNMLRTHGLWLAIVTLIFDALKSVAVCLWGYFWLKSSGAYTANLAMYAAGVSCVVGHCYPLIYKFKGGKGIATGFGMACVVQPLFIPIMLVVFGSVFMIWKVGSLASLTTVVVFFISEAISLLHKGYYASFILLLSVVTLIVYAHRKNIKKLVDNKENRIDLNEAVQKDKDYAKEQKEKREKNKKLRAEKKKNQNKNEEAKDFSNEENKVETEEQDKTSA